MLLLMSETHHVNSKGTIRDVSAGWDLQLWRVWATWCARGLCERTKAVIDHTMNKETQYLAQCVKTRFVHYLGRARGNPSQETTSKISRKHGVSGFETRIVNGECDSHVFCLLVCVERSHLYVHQAYPVGRMLSHRSVAGRPASVG